MSISKPYSRSITVQTNSKPNVINSVHMMQRTGHAINTEGFVLYTIIIYCGHQCRCVLCIIYKLTIPCHTAACAAQSTPAATTVKSSSHKPESVSHTLPNFLARRIK